MKWAELNPSYLKTLPRGKRRCFGRMPTRTRRCARAVGTVVCDGTDGQNVLDMGHALHFIVLMVAGWLQRRLEAQIEYLMTCSGAWSTTRSL